ncbi:MAG: glutamate ABC transporter substrate-binding protein [Propionibacteriales bacterium]|nr:glutamate ABC transporter substrate-binding protein [Propionibacteriales bacterium]
MRSLRRIAAPLVAVLFLAGCGYDATPLPKPEKVDVAPAAPVTPVECNNAKESYAPSNDRGAAIRQLKDRGRLVVGVSADTFQLGFTDPLDGDIKGFDIDFAQAVAEALDVTLQLRVITAAQRIDLLKSGEIDMVARNMTVNCTRWTQVAFSAVYYNATQKVLVRSDDVASYEKDGVESLKGKRVCAPTGSTSIDNITEKADVEVVAAANHTGCLIKFQTGEVDAITGDDTVLAGLAAQDPYADVPKQTKLTDEPYGLAVNKDDKDLARFINSVLEDMRSDGRWQASYDKWLKPYLLVDATPPTPDYGR